MRHRVKTQRLGRPRQHLDAMMRNMAASLFLHESIKTTGPKAKMLKSFAEKILVRAKRQTGFNLQRYLQTELRHEEACEKVTADLVARYKDRSSGFIRVTPLGKFRSGDAAPLVQVQLV